MTILEAVAIAAAGFGAGVINTVVGSGTLLTFPVLLGFGYAPVTANVSNTIGLVPGGATGTYGYRAELAGRGRRAASMAVASIAGALLGATLLLTLPASAFAKVVPYLIGAALVLILVQPWLSARLEARRRAGGFHGAGWTPAALFAIGVYGGYFGAAQGILLLGVLSLGLTDTLAADQRTEERARHGDESRRRRRLRDCRAGGLGRRSPDRGRLAVRRPRRGAGRAGAAAVGTEDGDRARRDRRDREAQRLTV